jgi:hypothetical protein
MVFRTRERQSRVNNINSEKREIIFFSSSKPRAELSEIIRISFFSMVASP